jgi:hypothetical protein
VLARRSQQVLCLGLERGLKPLPDGCLGIIIKIILTTNYQLLLNSNKVHRAELGGDYFDCTGYSQSDRFMKTVQKIADHIGQEYKGGGTTRTEVMTQTAVIIQAPTRPIGVSVTSDNGLTTSIIPPDVLDISDYQSAKKIVDYQAQNQSENRQKVFLLVWQQCTESMHAKIKAHHDYQVIEEEINGIELLRVITLICFNIEDEKYAPQKVHETKAAFYALKQGRGSDQAYQIKFMNTV